MDLRFFVLVSNLLLGILGIITVRLARESQKAVVTIGTVMLCSCLVFFLLNIIFAMGADIVGMVLGATISSRETSTNGTQIFSLF